MGFNNNIHAAFFLLIIITGVLTTITDLRYKKIRNNHLIIIALAAVILTIIKGFLDKSLPMLQLSSAGCAIIIAGAFYKNDAWRGGDAKFFVLFSFLMPVTGYESRIFLPCIALFANAFIIASIFLVLLFIKDLLLYPKHVADNIFKNRPIDVLINVTFLTLCVSWIIFPLIHTFGLIRYGFLSFLSVYVISFFLLKQAGRLLHNKIFSIMVFSCGLFFRYKFSPGFFLWKNFLFYVSTVVIYSVLSTILFKWTEYITKSNERVPFSPFLFLGCLLSYTPFLWWIMFLQKGIKI